MKKKKSATKRVAKPTMSPEAIEARYQAHLEKIRLTPRKPKPEPRPELTLESIGLIDKGS